MPTWLEAGLWGFVGGGALVVGAILVIGALVVDAAYEPAWWVHLIWLPIGAALTLGGLRLAKAWLLGAEYRNAAHEGRLVK